MERWDGSQMEFTEMLDRGAKELDIALSGQMLEKCALFYSLLLEWNQRMNLTALKEPGEIVEKHFLDSLTCTKITVLRDSLSVLDVGSGAGFPGIPLKIFFHEKRFTLLDSLKKRVGFLDTVINELNLSGIMAVHGRAEEFGQKKEARGQYAVVIARAVAELRVLAEFCMPLVQLGGSFIAMKGPQGEAELESAQNAVKLLGGTLEEVRSFNLPFTNACRTIIVIKKTSHTPPQYPRRPGLPEKKPL